MMRVLDAMPVGVEYGQIYVSDGDTTWTDPVGTVGGQRNGLCGAGWPGALMLITGLHTGRVLFTVDVADAAPRMDEGWEDVVEVSFRPGDGEVNLVEMMGMASYPIPLTPGVSYRVRYCASGMDGAQHQYPDMDELVGDRYLLSFWPAPPAADAVLKQTSEYAAYWHHAAAGMPVPSSPQQIAEVERLAQEQLDLEMKESLLLLGWGGRPPTERQRQSLGSNILGMVQLDRQLTDAVSAAGPSTQRAAARWSARRALEAAGLALLPWVAPALRALESGSPLPQPFDAPVSGAQQMSIDEARAAYDPAHDPFAWMDRDPAVAYTTVSAFDGGPVPHSRQHMALPALRGAADDDPLKAAMDAMFAAAVSFGDQYPALFAEVRRALPELS